MALPFSPYSTALPVARMRTVRVPSPFVRHPKVFLDYPREGPQRPAVFQIREHVGLGAVLEEVDETVTPVRDGVDADV